MGEIERGRGELKTEKNRKKRGKKNRRKQEEKIE